MKTFILICLLALLPVCTTLNCYSCTGCNDPFSASGVSNTGSVPSNTYCTKIGLGNVITRGGSSICVSTPWYLGIGQSCCTTDLCNGTPIIYRTPILLAVTLAVIFAKFQWA